MRTCGRDVVAGDDPIGPEVAADNKNTVVVGILESLIKSESHLSDKDSARSGWADCHPETCRFLALT